MSDVLIASFFSGDQDNVVIERFRDKLKEVLGKGNKAAIFGMDTCDNFEVQTFIYNKEPLTVVTLRGDEISEDFVDNTQTELRKYLGEKVVVFSIFNDERLDFVSLKGE